MFCTCIKLGTNSIRQRYLLDVRLPSIGIGFVRKMCIPCPVLVHLFMFGEPHSLPDYYTTYNSSTTRIGELVKEEGARAPRLLITPRSDLTTCKKMVKRKLAPLGLFGVNFISDIWSCSQWKKISFSPN